MKLKLGLLILITLLIGVGGDVARADDVIPLPDVTEADGRMGSCYAFYDNGARAAQMYRAGSRWDRFDFRWNVIEDTPGQFDYSGHDTLVALDQAHSLDVVGILGSTAAWAAADCPVAPAPTAPPALHGHPQLPTDDLWWRPCPPANLDLPWDDPDNAWGNFVYQTVSHFKGRVHVWEIWNEPDLTTYWQGTPEQYAQLLKVGYLAAKAADPEVTVLFGGLAYWGNPGFYQQVLTALAADSSGAAHNFYFDASSLHLYSNSYQLYTISREVRSNVAAQVGPHPLWLTEVGTPVWDEDFPAPTPYSVTADQAASFVIAAYAEARAAGADKFFFFRAHDDTMSLKYGLTRNDYSLRPAYVAYQVAARYLRGENQVTGPFNSPVRITFWGTPHGRVDVLWDAGTSPLTYTAPALVPQATLVDVRGVTRTLAPVAGFYHVPLAAAPIITSGAQVGGPPLLLIQTDTVPPTSTLTGLTQNAAGSLITLTWRASDALSGYWYEELQRAPAPLGPWTTVASWGETYGLTRTAVTMPSGTVYHLWYFRARARDRVGNWEPWPETAELSSAQLTRTVALSVTAYGDDQSVLLPLPDVSLAWRDAQGRVVSQTAGLHISSTVQPPVGRPWLVTATVAVGTYHVDFAHPDYLPARETFSVGTGAGVMRVSFSSTLHRVRGRIFLPLVLRQG